MATGEPGRELACDIAMAGGQGGSELLLHLRCAHTMIQTSRLSDPSTCPRVPSDLLFPTRDWIEDSYLREIHVHCRRTLASPLQHTLTVRS